MGMLSNGEGTTYIENFQYTLNNKPKVSTMSPNKLKKNLICCHMHQHCFVHFWSNENTVGPIHGMVVVKANKIHVDLNLALAHPQISLSFLYHIWRTFLLFTIDLF